MSGAESLRGMFGSLDEAYEAMIRKINYIGALEDAIGQLPISIEELTGYCMNCEVPSQDCERCTECHEHHVPVCEEE